MSTNKLASFSVRVPRELREEFDCIAEQDRRSVANVVRIALEDYAGQQRRGERTHRGRAA
jgi:predicted transcriptional regulator